MRCFQRLFGIERLASLGLGLLACGLAAAAVGGSSGIVLVSLAASGVGMTLAFTSLTTQIQDRSADELRGRIMALWFVGFVGSRPLAATANGLIADYMSVDTALVATAAIVVVASIFCRPGER